MTGSIIERLEGAQVGGHRNPIVEEARIFHAPARIVAENYLIFKESQNRIVIEEGAETNTTLRNLKKELNLPKNRLYEIPPSYRDSLGIPSGNSYIYFYVK
jgi:hypothetical protein